MTNQISWYEIELTNQASCELETQEAFKILIVSHHRKDIPNKIEVVNSWSNALQLREGKGNVPGFRKPQLAAVYALISHFLCPQFLPIIVLPTGTGKSLVMMAITILLRKQTTMILVPSQKLRAQFLVGFQRFSLLREMGLLDPKALNPVIGVLEEQPNSAEELKQFLQKANLVLCTYQMIGGLPESMFPTIVENCDLLMLDEAHHSEAENWGKLSKYFAEDKQIFFTATPFRGDQKDLKGKTLFNYSVKAAQKDGYFSKIKLVDVDELSSEESKNEKIAILAIQQLKDDLERGFNHVVMARCGSMKEAAAVAKIYTEKFPDVKLLHIDSRNKPPKNWLDSFSSEDPYRVIVCVDMIGEGFDLPQLKIAALHSRPKTLVPTLQLIGRVARAKDKLGPATIIASLKTKDSSKEVDPLFEYTDDFEKVLANVTDQKNFEVQARQVFWEKFEGVENCPVSIQGLKFLPNLKIFAIYQTNKKEWSIEALENCAKFNEDVIERFSWESSTHDLACFLLHKQEGVSFRATPTLYDSKWYCVFIRRLGLEEIFSPEEMNAFSQEWRSTDYLLVSYTGKVDYSERELKCLFPAGTQLSPIDPIYFYRGLAKLENLRYMQIGQKNLFDFNTSFQSYIGKNVVQKLAPFDLENATELFSIAEGIEEGGLQRLGVSGKGKIWEPMIKLDLFELVNWQNKITKKVLNEKIDPKLVFKNTLPTVIENFNDFVREERRIITAEFDLFGPQSVPGEIFFKLGHKEDSIFSAEIKIIEIQAASVWFSIEALDATATFTMKLKTIAEGGQNKKEIEFQKQTGGNFRVLINRKNLSLEQYLLRYPPFFYCADMSMIQGPNFYKYNQTANLIHLTHLIPWNWEGVNLRKESMKSPEDTDSIHSKIIEQLRLDPTLDVIFDDDGKGEIADILAFSKDEIGKSVYCRLYHAKYAKEGRISGQINNFYEVNGQVLKSTKWVVVCQNQRVGGYKKFFSRILDRAKKGLESKTKRERFMKGDIKEILELERLVKKGYSIKFEFFVVQPALSKKTHPEDILRLLGGLNDYCKRAFGFQVYVICSE